jgi:TonB-dependent SusC/RagA subfamily outer membrane receptor
MHVRARALVLAGLTFILAGDTAAAGEATVEAAAERSSVWTDAGAVAQRAGTIRGRVTDAQSGEPLSVVQVTVVGTTFSAVTDADGQFVITDVPTGLYTLRAQRLGYADGNRENVRVTDGATLTVDFALRTAALSIEELVVTGLADPTSARRAPFTVARVSGDNLQVPPANAVSSLQGKVAGVNAMAPAQPGAGINIVLRTPTSINRGNTPLIVVDGVILASTFGRSTTDLSSLDIESIEIVKGAAAASMYGSRAASGVIQIRTRRGAGLESGRTQFTVRSELGVNQLARRIDLSQHHAYRDERAG